MQVDVAPVGVVRARPKPALLDRQPPRRQVLAQGQLLADHRLAAVTPLRQLGDELVGVVSPAAGGDPAPLLLARRRVDAVVDDGVVLLALVGHVAAHDAVSLRSTGSEGTPTQLRRPDPGASTGGPALHRHSTSAAPRRSTIPPGRRSRRSSRRFRGSRAAFPGARRSGARRSVVRCQARYYVTTPFGVRATRPAPRRPNAALPTWKM